MNIQTCAACGLWINPAPGEFVFDREVLSIPGPIHMMYEPGDARYYHARCAPSEPSEPLVSCTDCASTGFYLDYAGPGIAGGVKVPCRGCGGRGWRPRRSSSG